MKKSLQLIILGALSVTATGHAQWNKIRGNGKIVTEERATAQYDEISVSGFFDVVLVSGKEGAITVKGEQNLLPYIKVEVKDNVLKIYTEKNINISTNEDIILTVPFEQISAVSLSGSGDLNLDVKTTDFEANLSGSGDVVLTGNSDSFTSKVSGSGDIDAVNLITKKANVTISGSGDFKVNCTDSLYARVSGSGNIAYKGNPAYKDTKVNGSGEISKI